MPSETINYYNNNANDFAVSTTSLDMSAFYAEFLPRVKASGHILDAGCGSGRDAWQFKQQGFKVSAFDASEKLAKIASNHLQQAVAVSTFEQLNEHNKYDGIWCCASLLHVSTNQLPKVLLKLQQALKPQAVLYASFKYGHTERFNNGRHFTDLNENLLNQLLASQPELRLIKSWQTKDKRPDRANEVWLNALVIKQVGE